MAADLAEREIDGNSTGCVGSEKTLVCLCHHRNDTARFETPIQDRRSDQRNAMSAAGRPTYALLLAHLRVGNLVDRSFRPRTRDRLLTVVATMEVDDGIAVVLRATDDGIALFDRAVSSLFRRAAWSRRARRSSSPTLPPDCASDAPGAPSGSTIRLCGRPVMAQTQCEVTCVMSPGSRVESSSVPDINESRLVQSILKISSCDRRLAAQAGIMRC